jgi:hypothetical protein
MRLPTGFPKNLQTSYTARLFKARSYVTSGSIIRLLKNKVDTSKINLSSIKIEIVPEFTCPPHYNYAHSLFYDIKALTKDGIEITIGSIKFFRGQRRGQRIRHVFVFNEYLLAPNK